jgi:cytochrome c5
MTDEHTSFIKTPKQLVVVVVLAFAVPIALIVLLSQLVTGIRPGETEDSEAAVLNRIKPVGEVALASASAPKGNMSGEQVYQAVCKTCHEAGLAGAPKVGDKASWAPRVKQGVDQLYAHAINGTAKGMPPKGGSQDLADVEVQRGVVYMANRSGASFKEPAAPASPGPAAGGAATAASTPPPSGGAAQPPTAAASKPGTPLDMAGGQALMQKDGCSACHAIDKKVVGPAYQDVAAKYKDDKGAAARLVQKVKAGGSGVWGQVPMPPNAAASDDDVRALVTWILSLKK